MENLIDKIDGYFVSACGRQIIFPYFYRRFKIKKNDVL